MSDTDTSGVFLFEDVVRDILSLLDYPAFWLLSLVYQLFFNVATAEIFSGDTIVNFYTRVQTIIGVFMMFQLAMSILRGIVDPDSFTNAKTGGSNLIMRIMTALALLVILTPVNIRGDNLNSWEKEVKNNGLLFGTLYSLQTRILETNTIGKLILGTSTSTDYLKAENSERLVGMSQDFSTTILKAFYRINLLPESQRDNDHPVEGTKEPREPYEYKSNWMCSDENLKEIQKYLKTNYYGDVLDVKNKQCGSKKGYGNQFAFVYVPILPMVCALIFTFILLSFCVDIAVRAIKIAILRLIAPIPVIGYMNPNGSKDGSFNAWVKVLSSTYLDLFIRLASVYFAIFVIKEIITHGLVVNVATGVLGVVTKILIFIGLFMFAKEAPKFIKGAIGIKDDGGKLFGGLGAIMGAGATAAGVASSFNSSRAASRAATEERAKDKLRSQHKHADGSWDAGWDEDRVNSEAKRTANRNVGKQLMAGLGGGVLGGITGAKAAMGAKDHQAKAASEAISKRNQKVREAGQNGGTFWGGVRSSARKALTGQSSADAMETEFKNEEQDIKNEQEALKVQQDELKTKQTNNAHRKNIMDYAKTKAAESDKTMGTVKLSNGTELKNVNYQKFHAALSAAQQNGVGVTKGFIASDGNFYTADDLPTLSGDLLDSLKEASWMTYTDGDGNECKIDLTEADIVDANLLKENQADYYNQAVADENFDPAITRHRAAYREATKRLNDSGIEIYDELETTFADLKSKYYDVDNQNVLDSEKYGRKTQEISQKSQNLSKKKQGYRARRAKANSGRYGGSSRS